MKNQHKPHATHAKDIYAIIKTGGKQYRVQKDDVIDVELLEGDEGSPVEFNEVLFFSQDSNAKVGDPHIAGCSVRGELLGVVTGVKIDSIKYKPSRNQYRRFGHRQHYTRVRITDIVV